MDKLFYSIKTFTTRNFLLVSISFWIVFIYLIFFTSSDFNEFKLLSGLKNWDSGHYIGIAENGYTKKYQFAFFPLYPMLIKIISILTGNYLSSALIISITSSVVGLWLFHSILKEEFNKNLKKIIISLLIFPTSFYLLLPYTEGLFFLLTMLFFYFLRKNIYLSSLFCALAIATKITGFALLVVLIYSLFKDKEKNKLLSLLIAIIPFSVFCIFQLLETKNLFYFLEAQAHWQRSLSLPFLGFLNLIIKISSTNIEKIDINDIINLGFAVFGTGLVLRSFRFLRLKYSIFAAAAIALPLFTGSLTSFPRFLVIIFPIFILIGKTKNLIWVIYLICSIFLLIYFSSEFIKGNWIS